MAAWAARRPQPAILVRFVISNSGIPTCGPAEKRDYAPKRVIRAATCPRPRWIPGPDCGNMQAPPW